MANFSSTKAPKLHTSHCASTCSSQATKQTIAPADFPRPVPQPVQKNICRVAWPVRVLAGHATCLLPCRYVFTSGGFVLVSIGYTYVKGCLGSSTLRNTHTHTTPLCDVGSGRGKATQNLRTAPHSMADLYVYRRLIKPRD